MCFFAGKSAPLEAARERRPAGQMCPLPLAVPLRIQAGLGWRRVSGEFVEQGASSSQILGVEPFGKPTVDPAEEGVGFFALVLLLP